MALSYVEQQIKWTGYGSSVTATISASGGTSNEGTSDEMTLSGNLTGVMGHFRGDNLGTAGSGDTMDIYARIRSTSSSVDSSDAVHSHFLCRIDTNTSDPAESSAPVPYPAARVSFYVVNNSGDNIAISGYIGKQKDS